MKLWDEWRVFVRIYRPSVACQGSMPFIQTSDGPVAESGWRLVSSLDKNGTTRPALFMVKHSDVCICSHALSAYTATNHNGSSSGLAAKPRLLQKMTGWKQGYKSELLQNLCTVHHQGQCWAGYAWWRGWRSTHKAAEQERMQSAHRYIRTNPSPGWILIRNIDA